MRGGWPDCERQRRSKVKLGILKTGAPPRALADHGTYPEMFRRLLGEDRYDYAVFDAERGELPEEASTCAAYLITGSACDAYDTQPWILELKRFLRAARGKAALVGICFGHQVMAEAFGGRVIKSASGWGLGSHTYQIVRRQPWMDEASTITLPASHQDQVVELPPACEVVACSAFAPFGMVAYTDHPAISLQLHPEFDRGFAAALAEMRRGKGPSDDDVDRAIASLEQPNDRERVAGWINRFIAAAGSAGSGREAMR